MSLFKSSNFSESIKGKDLFLDNDFLLDILKSAEFFTTIYPFLIKTYPIIEPLIAFEFLQTVFIPEEIVKRGKFINSELFYQATQHHEIFNKMQENALLLSKVYTHTKQWRSPSTIDLFLAGRVMYQRIKDPFILTANKKDYPSCVFDTVEMFAWEDAKTGEVKNYFILRFNQEKFDECYRKLPKTEEL